MADTKEYETFLDDYIKENPDATNGRLAFALCETYARTAN